MAKDDDKPAKAKAKGKGKGKAKGDKAKKGKKGKGAGAGLSVAGHPRAAAAVKRAKGFGGVGGFLLAAYFSYGAGVPPAQIGMRALAFGVAGYMLAWACSVTVWRHLVVAELRAAVESGRATIGPPPGDSVAGRGSARSAGTASTNAAIDDSSSAADAATDDDEDEAAGGGE
ncbi:MAG: hypothetical protein ACRDNJ_15210 [Solirubrobacteraceae bacterium]